MTKQIKTSTALIIVFACAVIIGGGVLAWAFGWVLLDLDVGIQSPVQISKNSNTNVNSNTNSAIDETADWKTYTNAKYGFSFKYPKTWLISEEEENYGDELKYFIKINYQNDKASEESYNAEVYEGTSQQTAKQFVENYFVGFEAGPSHISEPTINRVKAAKFFMEKASISGPAGSAKILFKKNSIFVNISTTLRQGNPDSASTFVSEIMNDKILNQIASTFQFTK